MALSSISAYAEGVFKDTFSKIDAIQSPVQTALPEMVQTTVDMSEISSGFKIYTPPILSEKNIIRPIFAEDGMVVTGSDIATKVGVDVLKKGGNAIDAAVATAFSMAVTMPRAGNLGGGGFMLVYDAKTKTTRAIDYREVAPKMATSDMYLNEDGTVNEKLIRHSFLSTGVPGTVKGVELAYKLYATMDWDELLKPAIRLADEGFVVDDALATSLKLKKEHLSKSLAARDVFFKPGGRFYERGDVLKQKDLAQTLDHIAKNGSKAFYEGAIADKIVAAMKRHRGIITRDDLLDYKARIREPVSGYYKGYKIVSMPPPSSGGVHLIQMLKILSDYDIESWGFGSAKTMHVMAEAMRLAYADRSKYLGDPDFVQVPTRQLMSDLYANRLSKGISLGSATPSELIEPGKFMPSESPQTTHFTIVDKWGNVVTNTYTLNFSYGSGHMVEGTGILLNNEMDDFAARVGAQNAYGLIGGENNVIKPGKRPLSSMTPTLVFDKNDTFYLGLGSPGGSRIITTVLQTIVNVIDHKMNLAEAIMAPRMHHQWWPDELRIEKGFSPDTLDILRAKGHDIAVNSPIGAVMAVKKVDGGYTGFADTRRGSSLALGVMRASKNTINSFDPLMFEFMQEIKKDFEEGASASPTFTNQSPTLEMSPKTAP
tara:strand:- start:114763 stop:116727 length:1965 start_codon:yes stop_codon:yes gene_type:complete